MTQAQAVARQRLGAWLGKLELPPPADPDRPQEEAAFEQLQNFFLLLLAASPEPLPESPGSALELLAPDLATQEFHQSWGRNGTRATEISLAWGLGDPDSPLFALQEQLVESLPEKRRGWLWEMGQMF